MAILNAGSNYIEEQQRETQRLIGLYIGGTASDEEAQRLRDRVGTGVWGRLQEQRAANEAVEAAKAADEARIARITKLVDAAESSGSIPNMLLAEILKKLHGIA